MNPEKIPLLTTDLYKPIENFLVPPFATLKTYWTIQQAIDHIRGNPPGQRVIYFYVEDEAGRLVGVMPVRRLLTETPECCLAEIMIPDPVTIHRSATLEVAWKIFLEKRFLALPVIDDEGSLVGVLDLSQFSHKDLVEITGTDHSDEIFQLLGIHLSSLTGRSPFASFLQRFPWLLANVTGGILCALLASRYEELLSIVIVLALFIPVVLALAESVSIQSVTLTMQSIHTGSVKTGRRLVASIVREFFIALMLGIGCGSIVGLTAGIWKGEWLVGLALLITITGSMVFACLMGLVLPVLLNKAKLNPRVAAGPLVLATADVATLLIFFELSMRLMV